jgi:hypothetical protein
MTWLLVMLIGAYGFIALFERRIPVRMPLYMASIVHVSAFRVVVEFNPMDGSCDWFGGGLMVVDGWNDLVY